MTICCVHSTFSYILGRITEVEIDSEIPVGFNSKFLIHIKYFSCNTKRLCSHERFFILMKIIGSISNLEIDGVLLYVFLFKSSLSWLSGIIIRTFTPVANEFQLLCIMPLGVMV